MGIPELNFFKNWTNITGKGVYDAPPSSILMQQTNLNQINSTLSSCK